MNKVQEFDVYTSSATLSHFFVYEAQQN